MMGEKLKDCLVVGPARPWYGGIAETSDSLAKVLKADVITFSRWPGQSPQKTDRMKIDLLNPLTWWVPKYDTVVFPYWHPIPGALLASIARRSGKKTVGLFHNAYPHEHTPIDSAALKYALRCCDVILTFSDFVGGQIHKLSGRRYRCFKLPASVDLLSSDVTWSPKRNLGWEGNNLLLFGNRREYKGLNMLQSALGLIRYMNINLRIFGGHRGNEAKYVDDVRDYFLAADAVVLPYISATQSGVIPTAFHFGKPVIATEVGGLPEYVQDGINGILAKPTSTSLAASIQKFYDMGYEKRLSAGAKMYDASWDSIANAVLD